MTGVPDPSVGCDEDRLARAHLSRVVEPGDRGLAGPLARWGAVTLVEQLRHGRGPEVWRARHVRLREPTSRLVQAAAGMGIGVVVPGDTCWPVGLDDLDDLGPRDGPDGGTPVCLWVRGRLPAGSEAAPAVAVVGARACTAYGEHVAEDLGAGLVAKGWTVVSGAAYGIDGAAHRGALSVDQVAALPTVAVLAGGVDRPSPAGHQQLLERLLEAGGAVVSELPPGTRPAAYRFLLRNRIIAAWGGGVVVVEASSRSGALSTARTAADLSRQVAAVPGPVTSSMSVGTNRLLRDGAVCVTSAADVVELVGAMGLHVQPALWDGPVPAARGTDGSAAPRGPVAAVEPLGTEAVRVWHALGERGDRSLAGLAATVGRAQVAVASTLAVLELAGLAVRDDVGWRRGEASDGRTGVVP